MISASEALRGLNTGNRVGVLGGTFDPVHNGHLAAAGAVLEGLGLDSVLFIPAALPPHKKNETLTPFVHRASMLELAVAGRPEFLVTGIEAERSGPSYSVDTLRQLQRLWDRKKHLFFILGLDAFMEIHSWKEYQELPRLAELVVLERPGHGLEQLQQIIDRHFPHFRREILTNGWMDPSGGGRVRPFTLEPVPVSSTGIRQAIAEGTQEWSWLVPPAVARYIRAHRLYESHGS